MLLRLGLELTSDETSELAFWITRNVKEPTSVTLRKVNGEFDERDEIDWDTCIEDLPKPKKVGKIRVIFKCIGRSKPL